MDLKTLGISPKAVLAFLFSAIAAVLTSAASWAESGDFSTTEIRAAVGGIVLSGIALIGAYVGRPGNVVPDPETRSGERGLALLEALVLLCIAAVVVLAILVL